MSEDMFTWKKFFTGFIPGKNLAKAFVLGVQFIVICSILFVLTIGGIKVYRYFFPKTKLKDSPKIEHVAAETVTQNSTTINQPKTDEKKGLINIDLF